MTMYGCDVSAYQPASPAWGPNRFAFVKATEGVGWVSPVWQAQIASGRAAGIGTGYYHFCDGRNTPQSEAQFYWNTIKDVWQPGEPIALDVEGPFFDYVADPVGWVLACAQELHRLSGLKPVFYSDWSHVKGRWNWQPLVDFDMGLWGAAYNPTGFGDPSPWPSIFVWQNADTNETGGDSNQGNFTDLATWRAYGTPATIQPANGGNVTPIPTEDIVATIDDLKNAIQDPTVLNAIAKAVHTYLVPHLDPATGQDDGHGTTLAAMEGAFDLQNVATRNRVDADVKGITAGGSLTDAQVQELADKLNASLPAANLAALKAKL